MKDIRIDSQGRQRCWNCGGTGFTEKRTTRSKLLVGVGTFLTKKKLQCQSCGEYNKTGNSKSYDGPASERAAKKLGTAAIDEQDAAPKEMSDSAPVYPNCERPKANAAPEKRIVSALLGAGILFLPFIFSWFTLRKGHSVLARILSFSWLVWFVVIMSGAQDGIENRVASTSGNASTEARQVNSKSNEATPDLEVKSQGNINPPSRSILHRLFNPDYPTQHPDEYPVSNATYWDVTSKTGCESKYSDAKKSDIFDSDYKNHWLTWKGTVELADASSASLNLDGKGIQDLRVEFSNSNAGYNLIKGSVITVKFLMKTSGGCILSYGGADGKIM